MEQARVYRLWANGRLKAAEMASAVGSLREIRSSIESLPPEPPPAEQPVNIRIVEIDEGSFIRDLAMTSPHLVLEHYPQTPQKPAESSTESLTESPGEATAEDDRFARMSLEELKALAGVE